jgi:hypothetical protein
MCGHLLDWRLAVLLLLLLLLLLHAQISAAAATPADTYVLPPS